MCLDDGGECAWVTCRGGDGGRLEAADECVFPPDPCHPFASLRWWLLRYNFEDDTQTEHADKRMKAVT